MSRDPIIQYNTADFQQQRQCIERSVYAAQRKIAQDSHCKALGLTDKDPPAIWRFVVGHRPLPHKLSKKKAALAKSVAEKARAYDPSLAGDPERYRKFRECLGIPTLRKTVAELSAYAASDAQLATWLTKLLAVRKGRGTRGKPEDKEDAKSLCQNWLVCDFQGRACATSSLCFYSDKAMAKLLYHLRHKKWLPLDQEDAQVERISKLYQRLHLVPAHPRAVRDLQLRAGSVHFVAFKRATPRRH